MMLCKQRTKIRTVRNNTKKVNTVDSEFIFATDSVRKSGKWRLV